MNLLYNSPGTAGLVVHWLLLELGVEHSLKMLNLEALEHKAADYLSLNPAGVVPTLVLDGLVISEAAAISLHLADLFPEARLAPAPGTRERAAYYQWMFFLANTMQPAFRLWFYPWEGAGQAHEEATKAEARKRLEAGWERLNVHLAEHGPYVLGDALSVVDFLATMLMRWSRNMPKTATAWPALAAHAKLMKTRPSFKEVYAREGLTDWT